MRGPFSVVVVPLLLILLGPAALAGGTAPAASPVAGSGHGDGAPRDLAVVATGGDDVVDRAIPPKPTGFGTHAPGYRNYTIARNTTSTDVAARLHYPALSWGADTTPEPAGSPWPVILMLPGGFGGSYTNGISDLFASHGFVVLDVDLSNTYGAGCCRNPPSMAADIPVVLDWLEDYNANASQPLMGYLDMTRIGVSGHSWGGLAAGMAVSSTWGDDRIDVAVPISSTPWGGANYTKDAVEPVFLMTGGSGDNGLQSLYDAAAGPVSYAIIAGETHNSILSRMEYPVAAFRYWLRNETDYAWWTYTGGIHADETAGTLTYMYRLATPKVLVSPASPVEDGPVTLQGWYEGFGFGNITLRWDLDGFGGWDANDSAVNVSHVVSFPTGGSARPRFEVADEWEAGIVTVLLEVRNLVPVAAAGADMGAAEDAPVSVNGSASSDTPSDLAAGLLYRWEFGDGTSRDWNADPAAGHTYPSAGTYTVTLRVRDQDGDVGNDTLLITVAEEIPVAGAGEDRIAVEDELLVLVGTGTDRPTDMAAGLDYSWDRGDGTAPTAWTDDPNLAVTYTTAGRYTVTLRVRDKDGAIGNDSAVVTVQNLAPTVTVDLPAAGVAIPKESAVSFAGTVSDTPSDLVGLEVRWEFGDGAATEWGPLPASAVHTYTAGGTYQAALAVRDPDGNVSTDGVLVVIENAPPEVAILAPTGQVIIEEDSVLALRGSATDTAGDQPGLTAAWFAGGVPIGTGFESSASWAKVGTVTIRLEVTDREGAVGAAETTVGVRNVAPTVTARANGTEVTAGGELTFEAVATDTAGDRPGLAVRWDFGDGTGPVTGATATHRFARAGTFTAKVTVTDDDGARDTAEITVTVRAAPPPPPPPPPPGPGPGAGPSTALLVAAGAGVAAAVVLLLVLGRKKGWFGGGG